MFASRIQPKTSRYVSSLAVLLLITCLSSVQAAQTLVPVGSVWKYLADGSNQGSVWSQPGFNDTTWASGPGPLGFGDPHIVTILPSGAVTYYFRHTFNVADPSAFSSLTVHLLRDDGAVVYLNGVEVFRSNMPGGPIAFNTVASSTVGGADETTYFQATVPASLLVSGANLLAVEVHQVNISSSDLGFDLGLNAEPAPVGPRVVSAVSDCANQVLVTFDRPVDPFTSQDPFNYTILDSNGGPAIIIQALPGPNDRSVILVVDPPLSPAQSYTLHTFGICEPDFENCAFDEQITPITFDTTAPNVSCGVAVNLLFPPNNHLVNVGLSASSSDPDLQVQVFSDEPGPDAQFSNGVLQLRAARNDAADGRVYLVVVTSTDACGNVGVCCTTVVVPHNASPAAVASVQAQAAAAQAQCSPSGSPTTPHPLLP